MASKGIMRVAIFYFVFVSTAGILIPFFSTYLNALGFSGSQIARVGCIGPILGLFVPLIWGFFADKTGRTAFLLKIACAGAAIALVALYIGGISSYQGMLAIFTVYCFFQSPLMPLADSLAIIEARRIGSDYARFRLWGSISFILVAFGFGQYLDRGGDIRHVPLVAACLATGAALCAHLLKQYGSGPHRVPPSFNEARLLLHNSGLMWFFIAGLIHQAALSPYYLFYGVFMDERGLGQGIVSWSFGLGVTAEVTMFWFAGSLLKRWPLIPILAVSFLLSTCRWLVVARLRNGPLMAILQTCHAFTFAIWYAGSIAYLEKTVAESLRVTSRALFAAITMSLGGVLGHSIAGWVRDAYGIATSFNCAAALDVVALIPLALAAMYATGKSATVGTFNSAEPANELPPPMAD